MKPQMRRAKPSETCMVEKQNMRQPTQKMYGEMGRGRLLKRVT